jgi:hypothetical protein
MYIVCAAESRVVGGVLVIFASQLMFGNLSKYFLPAPLYALYSLNFRCTYPTQKKKGIFTGNRIKFLEAA